MDKTRELLFLEENSRLVLLEWVPSSAYYIQSLQKRFDCQNASPGFDKGGTSDRLSCFHVTGLLDSEPNSAQVIIQEDEVKFREVEHRAMEFIRLDGVIRIAETGANHQQEDIGVEITRNGRVSYGLELFGKQSFDNLSRIIADLSEDTSRVMETLLNTYQRNILDVVYFGESLHRDKYIVLLATGVTDQEGRKCGKDALLANSGYVAELSQILGKFHQDQAADLHCGGFSIHSDNGILLVAADAKPYLELLRITAVMNIMLTFINNMFLWVFSSWDTMEYLRSRIQAENLDEIISVQSDLAELNEQQALLGAVAATLEKNRVSLQERIVNESVLKKAEELGLTVFGHSFEAFNDLGNRISDLQAAIKVLGHEIENSRLMASALSDKESYGINKAMNVLTLLSGIILPMTLITGIYGMNFYRYHPPAASGASPMKLNMPELYWEYGYIFTLALMAFSGLLTFVLIRRYSGLNAKKSE